MATVNLGRIKPVFRGAYAGGTAYVVDDIVTSGNETFICIQASTGNATTSATHWTKLAAKGTDGTNGTDVGTVITTQGDILYRDGSGLQRLGYGTAGQLLKTGGSGANPSWTDAPSGVIKKIHVFSKSNRITHNQTGNTSAFTWTSSFVPLDPVNNSMKITGIVPINQAGQNFTGFGLRFSKSGGSDYDFNGYGSMYAAYESYQGQQSYIFTIPANTFPAGTFTIYHRIYADGSGADSYFPNSSDDSRLTQTRGDLIIEEYKN